MLSTMTAAEASARKAWPSRYEQLERLEVTSRPPAPPPPSDPHLGVTVFNYTGIEAAVDLLLKMSSSERQTVAVKLAQSDRPLADAFADMLIDDTYDATANNAQGYAEAAEAANDAATRNTAKWCQTFLSHYYGKPVQLRHIMAGFNLGNGYPYQIFGYRFAEA